MALSSPNRMVWVYFRSLERIVSRAQSIADPFEQRDEIAVSLFVAVAAVEVFVNVFFRVLVEQPRHRQGRTKVLHDLKSKCGLRHKLNDWPPKILGKSLAWQTGAAFAFQAVLERRNELMHFTSSHESQRVPGGEVQGLPNTAAYDALVPSDAVNTITGAQGIVAEILRLSGIPEGRIAAGLHLWTGRVV